MAQGKPRDPRKEQQWRSWLLRWQHSGLTVSDFCRRHHLGEPSFYAWRRQLQQRDAAAANFVPVRVIPDEPHQPAIPIHVVLANGRQLHITPGFDPATLRQLLAVLEETPPC
jgi:Transposase